MSRAYRLPKRGGVFHLTHGRPFGGQRLDARSSWGVRQRKRYRLLDLEWLGWRLGTEDLEAVRRNLEASLAEAMAREQVRRGSVLDRESGGGQRRVCRSSQAIDPVAARD
jgi:hypothetical protein